MYRGMFQNSKQFKSGPVMAAQEGISNHETRILILQNMSELPPLSLYLHMN